MPFRWFLLTLILPALACAEAAEGAASAGARGGGTNPKAAPERPPAPVAVKPAVRGPISSYYVTTTTLEAERVAPVLARVTGTVERIDSEEGDRVKAGQVLLRIDNDQYRLRVAQLAARTAQLKDRYARLKRMVEEDLIGEEEREQAKHELAAATAEEDLARLDLSYTKVRAPFSGRIIRRQIDVGQVVQSQAPLFELADLQPLLARVFVPSKAFRRLKPSQEVELTLDSSGVELTGAIKLISPIIDATTGTIKVTLEISSYPEGTRAGDFAHAQIVTERHDDAVIIPTVAVVEAREERVVFVAKDGQGHRRLVKLGFEHEGQTEVVEGLEAGEMVVVQGQHALEDADPIKVLDSGA